MLVLTCEHHKVERKKKKENHTSMEKLGHQQLQCDWLWRTVATYSVSNKQWHNINHYL